METEQRDQFGGAATGGTASQAKEKVQQLAGQAQEQVTSRLSSGAAQAKGQASGAVGNFAEAMRQVGQQFREQDRGLVGGLAERAAQEADRLAQYLQHTDVDDLVRQVERVARRRPAVFLVGTFVAGVAGARFLKSSRRQWSQRLDAQRTSMPAMRMDAAAPLADSSGVSRGGFAELDVTERQPLAREGGVPPLGGTAAAPTLRADMDDLRPL